jgi:hypothetical protein
VAITSLSLPTRGASGSAARAEVLLRSDNPKVVPARITVRQGPKVLVRDEVKIPPGDSVFGRPVLLKGEGLTEFTAELQATNPDSNTDRSNDAAKAWVGSAGKRVLLIGHEGGGTTASRARFPSGASASRLRRAPTARRSPSRRDSRR